MSLRIHSIPQVISTVALLLCLPWLCSGGGCATTERVRVTGNEKTWRCNKQADNAMKQHDYGKAITLHQRLLDKEPSNGLALYHLGYAYGQTGDHLREVCCYEKAVGLGFKKDHIFLNLGMAYGELDQLENAIGAFDKAVEINPGNADAHFGLALARYRGLADNLAEEEFLKAIEIDPAHLDARLYLSMLYADRGELQKACEQLRNILEIDPTHTRAREFLERIERE